jgi:hypothetical protein
MIKSSLVGGSTRLYEKGEGRKLIADQLSTTLGMES